MAPAEFERLAAAQLEFALDLYRAADEDPDSDLVLGPGSLHTALSMVLAGARGDTALSAQRVSAPRTTGRRRSSAPIMDAA